MSDQLFVIICGFVFAVGLWWLYFIEYRTYRVDLTRQRLFKIRDDLFKKAEEGIVPFDSKAYGIARTTLNGMIRFAHDLSFLRILIILFTYKKIDQGEHAKRYQDEYAQALKELTEPAQEAILMSQLDMHLTLIAHVVRSSLIMMMLIEPLHFVLLLHRWKIRQLIKSGRGRVTLSIVDAEAKEIGDDLAIAA